MLYRYARYAGMDTSVADDTNILSYDDAFTTPSWAMAGFQFTCAYDLLAEKTEGGRVLLAAGDAVTRAELSAALKRLDLLADPLSLWTDGAAAKTALIAYMAAITDESSEDYIPVRDRIAVFDLDGTLFCETDPNYFDYTLLKYRVLEDPNYKDKASDFEREVANKIKEQNETGKSFPGLEVDHGKAVASAFAGMTVAAFNAYIQAFKELPMPSYDGMQRGDGWYLPMLQVVKFLQANGFTVYVVSGTDRLIVRGIVDGSPLDIPNRQIIGSDETIVSSNQNGADGLNYVFADGDELILGGDFLIKNLKMNKVAVIAQEIGQQPVLSFGNSTGDSSMAEYVTSNNPYRSLAFMLCCDDLARENGNESKAQKMFDLCEQFDWIPVSMKNDWTTIYGPGVTYLGADKAA
jgi:phosphoserine phosphatase